MYLLIPLLPILGSGIGLTLGRYLGGKGVGLCTTLGVMLSTILSVISFYEVALSGSAVYIEISSWFQSELLEAKWGLIFDSLTVVMLIVVTSVSTLVHIYSLSYMSDDPHIARFMSYLSLFTVFMLILVTSDNLIGLFLGWEGVGLASYLLINFWSTRISANKSAIKAMIMNRVGDMGLALGIMTLYVNLETVNYSTLFALIPYCLESKIIILNTEIAMLELAGILLFIGAVGKSAQLGLHTWLPDAMEGPTPVSALIHAATMVTAGVFLIARCSPLYENTPVALSVITIVGGMTAIFASTTGLFQNDIKRVIAYSTCSQIGYMVFACGLSAYGVGLFHLANHAFFKALLFLSAGSLIHGFSDEQDMRKMGGLVKVFPLTYSVMLIGSLSLAGFPFLTGYYSKDVILEISYSQLSISSNFAYWLGTLSVAFTSYYSFRLISLSFLSEPNGYKEIYKNSHEGSNVMAIVFIPLVLGSIFIGYILKDLMIGAGTDFWGNSIEYRNEIEAEYCPIWIKLTPLVLSISGGVFSLWLHTYIKGLGVKLTKVGYLIYLFLNKRWLIDKIYNDLIGYPLVWFGYIISFKTIDKGILEIIGPSGIMSSFQNGLNYLSRFHTGYVYHSAFIMVLGVFLIITIIMLESPSVLDIRLIMLQIISAIVLVSQSIEN